MDAKLRIWMASACLFFFWIGPAHASGGAPGCDLAQALKKAQKEIGADDTDPGRLRTALSAVLQEQGDCLNDGNGNRIPDQGDQAEARAIKALQSAAQQWNKAGSTWTTKAKSVMRADCDAMKRVQEAYQGIDFDESAKVSTPEAWAVSSREAKTLKAQWTPTITEGERIVKLGQDLSKVDELKGGIASELAKAKERLGKLKALADRGALKGRNIPLIQFWINYGKEQHDAMTARHTCVMADKKVPGGGSGRPDCVQVLKSYCRVLEFKPNSKGSKSKGKAQLARYVPDVTDYFQDTIDGKRAASAAMGGTAAVEAAKEFCLNNKGKVRFTGEVKTYDRYSKPYKCTYEN